eukprot:TRINITY_DN6369_c0_g1_i1.p1 TRINITY_DN6369_c0_g1~~TRINITY_DN6369_c0_g1_i1.p1  ORF type:complete len:522 (+),score=90.27 TRINITY_DN6369_c0_g1_i1:49-1614(+)
MSYDPNSASRQYQLQPLGQAYHQPVYGQQVPSDQIYVGAIPPQSMTSPVMAPSVLPSHDKQKVGNQGEASMVADDQTDYGGRFVETGKYRDVFWMILFYAQLIAIVVILIINSSKIEESIEGAKEDVKVSSEDMERTAIFFVISCMTATVFAFLSLEILKRYTTQLIWFSIAVGLLVHIGLIVLSFYYGIISAGVILSIFIVLHVIWVVLSRKYIPLSVALVQAMLECMELYPAMIVTTFAVVLVQIAWLAIWIYTASITFLAGTSEEKESETGPALLSVFLMLSYVWTSEVLKNVVHVTVAGTTATWYFHATTRKDPTLQSFKRATTTSFGSICFGSLLVAIMRIIRYIAESARKQSDSDSGEKGLFSLVFMCIGECIIRILGRLLEIFNYFAYIQIAIYGSTFIQAGKDAWSLFKSSGMELLVNNNLMDGVVFLLHLLGGVITGLTTGIWYAYAVGGNDWILIALLGFLIGYLILGLVMSVVSSGVNTIFVCYAEDPQALSIHHPTLASQLQSVRSQAT